MKEIKLTRGLVALVDDDDFEWLNQWKWHALKAGYTFYALRVITINGKQRHIPMHRDILGLTDPKIFGDHKDRDGLNNQLDNLRVATNAQNQANTKSRQNSSSKYLGVCWSKKDKRWVAQIQKHSKRIYLGCYKCEAEAALVYNQAAMMIHGEFANINKISS